MGNKEKIIKLSNDLLSTIEEMQSFRCTFESGFKCAECPLGIYAVEWSGETYNVCDLVDIIYSRQNKIKDKIEINDRFYKCCEFVGNRMLNPLKPEQIELNDCCMTDSDLQYLNNNRQEITDYVLKNFDEK